MNFPEYKKLNDQYHVALLIDDLEPITIAKNINQLISDATLYEKLKNNCRNAAQELNWQKEEKDLIKFYNDIP